MLEIPDIFWGRSVDAGPKPTYEKKRVPLGPKAIFTALIACVATWTHTFICISQIDARAISSTRVRTAFIGCICRIEYDIILTHQNITCADPEGDWGWGPNPLGKSQSFPASIQCWATIDPPGKRHWNGVSLAGRWWPAIYISLLLKELKHRKMGPPLTRFFFDPHMQQLQGHSCEKTYLRGSRTANALTSVRICAVWSAPSLFAYWEVSLSKHDKFLASLCSWAGCR